MTLPERSYTGGSGYRFGFNGKETDKEYGAGGGTQDYGFRMYSPAIGKFLSVDPLAATFPFYTPYQFSANKPINSIDLDGLEDVVFDMSSTYVTIQKGDTYTSISNSTGISIQNLRNWNGYHDLKLPVGEQMKLYPSSATLDEVINLNQGNNIKKATSLNFIITFGEGGNANSQIIEGTTDAEFNDREIATFMVDIADLATGADVAVSYGVTRQATRGLKIGKAQKFLNWLGWGKKSKVVQEIPTISNKFPKDPMPINGKITASSISEAGKILNKNGDILHAPKGIDFIVNNSGDLVLGKKHMTLANGETVQAAGTLTIKRGQVTGITNWSGHYQPTVAESQRFKQILSEAGVDVSKAIEDILDFSKFK